MEYYYNIHNIITVGILTKRPVIVKEYDYYIRHFKTEGNIREADLSIQDLENFVLPKESFKIDNNVFGFKNGIYNKSKEYAIIFENNRVFLYAKDASISLHVLIEYLLLKRGATFLHGAAISYKDKGIIFPAPPSTGKTILVSKMRNKENVKLFGDDFAIIGNGNLYAFPSDFSIYKYHFDFFPELKKTSAKNKIKKAFFERGLVMIIRNLPIKKAIKKLANVIGYEYLMGGQYLKIPAKNLVLPEKFGKQASLKYTILLEKYDGKDLKIEKINSEAASLEMADILKSEWKDTAPALNLLSKAGVFDANKLFTDAKEIFIKELGNSEIRKVFLPDQLNNKERTEKLEKYLERELFSRI